MLVKLYGSSTILVEARRAMFRFTGMRFIQLKASGLFDEFATALAEET
jgi:hypothetical protein